MRKLASIQQVRSIEPIAGADAIELARINGWQCVVKKGEFRPGELGVYLEIDSVPPETAAFSWLWRPKDAVEAPPRPAKTRIKTLRLRGVLSQGLLLPLGAVGVSLSNPAEGDDLTEKLGVTKYEPPAPSGMGDYRAPFPGIVPKTDEMRVQSFPELLNEMKGRAFTATVKVDGTSATFINLDGDFHVCGRNHSIVDGENLYWYVAKKHKLQEVLADRPNLAIQGEVVGPGIQKNALGLKDKTLFVFNIYDAVASRHYSDAELRAFCADHKLTPVPVAFVGNSFDESVESLLAKAEGVYDGTKNEREGVVVRPVETIGSTILCGRFSFKAISNRFLLKEKD